MVRHAFGRLQYQGELGVREFGDDLEGSEELLHALVKVLGLQHLLERDKDGGGLDGSVALGDVVGGDLLRRRAKRAVLG